MTFIVKKRKDGLKRKRKIRTTCFKCELSMDEEYLGSHWTKQHCSRGPKLLNTDMSRKHIGDSTFTTGS